MNDLVLITGYKETEFENDKKEKIDIVKVSYLTKQNGQAIGFVPNQSTFKDLEKKEILKSLQAVPGMYEAMFGIAPGKNNKPEVKVIGFSLVQPLDFSNYFE